MLHPSYTELIKVVNSEVEDGDTPVVNSRYSIVLATAKRARQIIDGKDPMSMPKIHKPLSIAVDELNKGLLKIMPETAEEEAEEIEAQLALDLKQTKQIPFILISLALMASARRCAAICLAGAMSPPSPTGATPCRWLARQATL